MEQKYFAMDFAFYSSMGAYKFEDCCEMSRAAGYDAMDVGIQEFVDKKLVVVTAFDAPR